jgi:hypothetical protein
VRGESTSKYHVTTKCTKDTKDSEIDIFEFLNFVLFVTFFENCGWGEEMRLPRPSPPNVLIGGPVRISPGFPLKACGNDGLVEELGVEDILHFHSLWASVRS